MSRIGNAPVTIPDGVTVHKEQSCLRVQGTKGEQQVSIPRQINVLIDGNILRVARATDSKKARSLHGTTRAHIANAVHGVSKGWQKILELVGVGYRAKIAGDKLTLTVGFSHPVEITAPEGITFEVKGNKITVVGIDKNKVGDIAAKLRAVKPPEPYKGKGIRYLGEIVRKKAGKAAKAVGAA